MIIYIAINIINKKSYIGQTVTSLKYRKSRHINDACKRNSNTYFHRSIKKYGEKNFIWEVLCECKNRIELNNMEQFCIIFFNSLSPNGYNLTIGGDGKSGYKMSEETKLKIGKANKGHKHTDECKKKMSLIKLNNPLIFTEEVRKNFSKASKGRQARLGSKCSIETKEKMRKARTGRKLSEESKKKLSEINKGKKVSDETKKKIGITIRMINDKKKFRKFLFKKCY